MAALYVGLAVATQYAPILTPAVALRLPSWPRYVVSALVFFLLVAIMTGLLSVLAQGILAGSGKREMNEVSQVVGFVLASPQPRSSYRRAVIRSSLIASWGTREATRHAIITALEQSDLRAFFETLTPTVLRLIRPFLPGGLPEMVLTGLN